VKKSKKSSFQKGKDLVAAATNPYYQDINFLEKVKKKNEKLLLTSKTGSVFTAVKAREDDQRKKEELANTLKALEQLRPKTVMEMVEEHSTPVVAALNPNMNQLQTLAIATGNLIPIKETDEHEEGQTASSHQSHSQSQKQIKPAATTTKRYTSSAGDSHFASDKAIHPLQQQPPSATPAIALPSIEELTMSAAKHKEEIVDIEMKKQKQKELMISSKPKENFKIRQFRHPRELDAEHIAKMKASFRYALYLCPCIISSHPISSAVLFVFA
jgi:hypothetical protein